MAIRTKVALVATMCLTGSLATAQIVEDEGGEVAVYTAIAYAPGEPDIQGFSQGKKDKDSALKDAMVQCQKNGNSNCYPGLVYKQCGAIAELQLGNPSGNPKGWAPASSLREALDQAIHGCNNFARSQALIRYDDDTDYGSRAATAKCTISYYHCSEWGSIDPTEKFGPPDIASLDTPAPVQ